MRLLVVEDFAPLRAAIVTAMRDEGWSVDECAQGDEASLRVESSTYDVVVLDIQLPGIDGLEVLRRMRSAGSASHVLLLTARDTVSDRVRGLDLGADDYLVKPFAMAELIARLRALLRRGYKKKNSVLQIGHMTIDTAGHGVCVGDEPVELTAKEYALLEYLAFRVGEVVSRTEIWEHVYDDHASASSNVVDVYIGYLRKKLERDGLPQLIQTRRGAGYMLAGPDA